MRIRRTGGEVREMDIATSRPASPRADGIRGTPTGSLANGARPRRLLPRQTFGGRDAGEAGRPPEIHPGGRRSEVLAHVVGPAAPPAARGHAPPMSTKTMVIERGSWSSSLYSTVGEPEM